MEITPFLMILRAIDLASGGLERRFSRHIKLANSDTHFSCHNPDSGN
jgi:hypothetical protein